MWSFVYPSPPSTVSGTGGGLRNRCASPADPARVDRRANENLLELLWCDDPTRRAFITPAVRLGGKAEAAEEEAASSAAAAPACTAGVAYDIGTVPVAGCGGRPLRPMDLDGSETGPKAMKVTPAVPLDAMKLNQLKAELAARGARQAGLKAVLQRRLHGLLMADAVTRAAGRAAKRSSRQAKHKATKRLHAEIFGSDSDDDGPPEYKSSDSWDEE